MTLLLLLSFAAGVRAQEWTPGPASAEYRFTMGSDSYWGHAFHGQASMVVDPHTRPFARFDYQIDRPYMWNLTWVLGAEQDLSFAWTGRAAAGLSQGQLRGAGSDDFSYFVELGLDNKFSSWRWGAVNLTSCGPVDPVGGPRASERDTLAIAQAQAPGQSFGPPPNFWFDELSVYAAKALTDRLRLGLAAAAWARTDAGRDGRAERADLSFRIDPAWSISAGLGLEEPSSGSMGAFGSVGVRYAVAPAAE